jgi:ArsR family transcriptional regulator, lead/cadmium/zinc/bismuth-responsive transcriptional repressor
MVEQLFNYHGSVTPQLADVATDHGVEFVSEYLLSAELAQRVATNFWALSDPTRVRIIHALTLGELRNGDLAEVLGLSESAVSHQMKDLRLMNLVTAERHGREVRYRLNDSHVRHIFEDALKHVQEPSSEAEA